MRIKVLIFLVLILLLSFSTVFAVWDKKPELRWLTLYRLDDRRSHDSLYINRVSAMFDFQNAEEKSLFKVTPFSEFRRNFERNLWERIETGVEVGKDFTPWFYLGEGIQSVWLREDYTIAKYNHTKRRDSTESETRLVLSHQLFSNQHITLKGFFMDEYTYDFDLGRGVRNEVAVGIAVPIGKHFETSLNWRHVDRIHDFDSDTLEFGAALVF